MIGFADRTGLSGDRKRPKRYLWTDAFAVCNFCELYRLTGKEDFRRLAVALVAQVHAVLGKHRQDDSRQGWISGLSDDQASEHPAAAGLRIGKTLNERGASEPVDTRREWDRDGQYFHYLTKWMHALHQTARMTGDPRYLRWAVELAKVAHACFTYTPPSGGPRRMYWKMSIDLSRPLVPSMGHHDPLDALVTYLELDAAIGTHPDGASSPDLRDEVGEAAAMCAGKDWTTDDPLGLGGLLFDANRLAQLHVATTIRDGNLLESLLLAACRGLDAFVRGNPLGDPIQYRLAFRELGLSIGLHATTRMGALLETAGDRIPNGRRLRSYLQHLRQYGSLTGAIEAFWRQKSSMLSESWMAHADINTVMLATSLIPDGFLSLVPAARGFRNPPPDQPRTETGC